MKKNFIPITALLILTALFFSCAGQQNTGTGIEQTTETAAEETEVTNADIIRQRYQGTDYEGYSFRVLSPKPGSHFYWITGENENEIYYETQTGDVLNDAIYKRNIQAEDFLHFKLEPVWSDDTGVLSSTVKKSVMADDDGFDIILNRLDFLMNGSAENLHINLTDVRSIDTADPWWDKNIITDFTLFNNKLFTIAGDINYYDDYAVLAFFHNKAMCEDLGFDQPYDSVTAGKWTFERFTQMVNASSSDLNGDGAIKIKDDQFGYVNHEHSILHLIYALGEKMSTVDGDGIITVNRSENLINVVGELYDFHKNNQAVCTTASYDDYMKSFKDGRTMFFAEVIGGLSTFRDMEEDFGVLPVPKRNEEQQNYSAYVSNGWTTALAIPLTSNDPERAGTVLTVMSAFSSDTITTALYDVLLESKLIRDTESQDMLSYVFASKVYDWAGDLAWADDLRAVYASVLPGASNTFVSSMEKRITAVQKKLDAFIESFAPEQ
jgi:hypothetical protein